MDWFLYDKDLRHERINYHVIVYVYVVYANIFYHCKIVCIWFTSFYVNLK